MSAGDTQLDRIEDLEKQLEALQVQVAFWKQAAEHAVDGWLKQEEVNITLRDQIVSACDVGLFIIDHVRPHWSFTESSTLLERLKADALVDAAWEGQ